MGVLLQIGIPAKQGREVEQSLGHDIGRPVDANANVGHVPLTQLLPLCIYQQTDVCKVGWLPSERIVQLNMFRCGDEPFLPIVNTFSFMHTSRGAKTHSTPNNMCNLHEMIVDDIGEVIGWETITFHDDKVVFLLCFLVVSVHEVQSSHRLLGGLESNNMRLAVRRTSVGLALLNVRACPWIMRGATAGSGLLEVELKILLGAKTAEGMATLKQRLRMLCVEIKPFRLLVRAKWSSFVWTFIPVQSGPP